MLSLGSRGESKVGTLIYILVAILIIYAFLKIVPPYMRYYSMDDEVAHQIHMSKINSLDVIHSDLVDKAEDLELPIGPDDIEISKDDRDMLTVYIYWEEEVDFGYGIARTLEFEIDATGASGEE